MEDAKTTQDPRQFAGKAVETMALWTDASQRIMNQLVELGAGAAKESARLYAEFQQTTVDVLRDTQATALRWQTLWPEGEGVRSCQGRQMALQQVERLCA